MASLHLSKFSQRLYLVWSSLILGSLVFSLALWFFLVMPRTHCICHLFPIKYPLHISLSGTNFNYFIHSPFYIFSIRHNSEHGIHLLCWIVESAIIHAIQNYCQLDHLKSSRIFMNYYAQWEPLKCSFSQFYGK